MSQFVARDISQTILDTLFLDTLYCKTNIVIPNCKNKNDILESLRNILISECKIANVIPDYNHKGNNAIIQVKIVRRLSLKCKEELLPCLANL